MDSFEIIDERFRATVLPNALLEVLGKGFRWLEGPVWFADHDFLLFSDIPNDRLMPWSEDGGVFVFREPSGCANGHRRDMQGWLVGCSHQVRRISRTELDGAVADDFEGPNGLAFSPDERTLYVSESGKQFDDEPRRVIRAFDVDEGCGLTNVREFHVVSPGFADGFCVDEGGNLWSSAADGIHCIDASGVLLGKVLVPYSVSNLAFVGRNRSRLFICAFHILCAIYTNVRGAERP